MIRPAEPGDLDRIEALLVRAAPSVPCGTGHDREKARAVLLRYIVHDGLFSWVSNSRGALFGRIEEWWYSRERRASDLFFYAEDGSGVELLRRFSEWAAANGACSLVMSISSDRSPERTAEFYARSGLTRIGAMYYRRL